MVVNGSWLFVAPHLSHNAPKDEGTNVILTQKMNEVVNKTARRGFMLRFWTADERSVPVRINDQQSVKPVKTEIVVFYSSMHWGACRSKGLSLRCTCSTCATRSNWSLELEG